MLAAKRKYCSLLALVHRVIHLHAGAYITCTHTPTDENLEAGTDFYQQNDLHISSCMNRTTHTLPLYITNQLG